MNLKLTNTISGKKEKFIPIHPEKVGIYCCGVTVYDLCHLGHARSYLNWDILRRYLIWQRYKVFFVQNFTDIDDKIIKRAEQEGCSMNEVSNKNINEFYKDMDSLDIIRADRMPRATECIPEIIKLICELENKGIAYQSNGDVYFSVAKYSNYGKLSRRNIDDQIKNAGGRISSTQEEKKTDIFDFALWKKAKDGEKSYSSPWGQGRPGWHIECSAMVREELGETIDIHLGGSDLIFPHHENEIAQSEAVTGKQLSKYWLHNGMVNVEGEKMSKSLGNFTTIRALLNQGITSMTLRFFVLQANYRKPLDFTKSALDSASKGWKNLNNCLSFGYINFKILNWKKPNLLNEAVKKSKENIANVELSKLYNQFQDFMNDDLNTSGALSILFKIAKPIRKLNNSISKEEINNVGIEISNSILERWEILIELAYVLGLKADLKDYGKAKKQILNSNEIETFIQKRALAKLEKDFNKADEIRDTLKKYGIELIDKPNGITTWSLL